MNAVSLLVFLSLSLVVLGFLAFAWSALQAPEGYEDDAGFHLGQEPLPSSGFMGRQSRHTEIASYGSGEEKVACGSLVRAA